MTCSNCQETIAKRNNIIPMFCPHCHFPLHKAKDEQPPPPIPTTDTGRYGSELFKRHKAKAQENDPEAHYQLAIAYQQGIYTQQNLNKALQHFKAAAAHGHLEAIYATATAYYRGLGTLIDNDIAYQYFSQGADLGHLDCLYHLCLFLMDVHSRTYFRPGKAFSIVSQLVEEDYLKAFSLLGRCYEEGIGTQIQMKKAVYYYERGCQLQQPYAFFKMGELYKTDTLGPINYKSSLEHHLIAGELGHYNSLNRVAEYYLKGQGVPQDLTMAIQYFKKSGKCTEENIPYHALYTLAQNREDLDDGEWLHQLTQYMEQDEYGYLFYILALECHLERDYEAMLACFQQASDRGLPAAHHSLGVYYDDPDSAYFHKEACLYHYQIAAKSHFAPSMLRMGKYFQGGTLLDENPFLALDLYKKLADQDHPEGTYQLSQCYLHGIGISKNEEIANYYLRKSKSLGYTPYTQ